MKNLKVKAFKTVAECLAFVQSKGYNADKQVVDSFFEKGYFQFKRWHVVVDPFGKLQPIPKKTSVFVWIRDVIFVIPMMLYAIGFFSWVNKHEESED